MMFPDVWASICGSLLDRYVDNYHSLDSGLQSVPSRSSKVNRVDLQNLFWIRFLSDPTVECPTQIKVLLFVQSDRRVKSQI